MFLSRTKSSGGRKEFEKDIEKGVGADVQWRRKDRLDGGATLRLSGEQGDEEGMKRKLIQQISKTNSV